MKRYSYNGPVVVFGVCIANNWTAETLAVSEAKARSNFAYQFKKATNRNASSANIIFPGKIVCLG